MGAFGFAAPLVGEAKLSDAHVGEQRLEGARRGGEIGQDGRIGLDGHGPQSSTGTVEGASLPQTNTLTDIYPHGYDRLMNPRFEVLAEPNRRRILDLLRISERPVGELVDALSVSQPAVSKHLRVLREAGFVEVRVDAQRRLYRLRPEPLQRIDQWLAPYRELWSSRLDLLERHLDEMAKEEHERS